MESLGMASVQERPNQALLDAVRDELARHRPEVAASVLDVLVAYDEEADDLDPAVWGPRPTLAEVAAAEVATHRLLALARRAVVAASLTRAEAAEVLGVGSQRVSRLVEDGELVTLEEGGQLRLPRWQFHPDTAKGRLEGIRAVSEALAGGPVVLSQWMLRPNPALGGRRPVDALRDGDPQPVLVAARSGA